MGVKYTIETFKEKLIKNGRVDLELIGEYKGLKNKTLFKCKICGNEWTTCPEYILSGTKCPTCRKKQNGLKRKKTNEQFLEDFKKKGDPNVEILEEYQGNTIHIKVGCKTNPNHKWEATPKDLLNKKGCPYCKNKRISNDKQNSVGMTHPELLKYFINQEDAFKYTIGSRKKFYFRCPECGKIKSTPIPAYNLFFFGFKCEFCKDTSSIPNKFIREVAKQLFELKEIDEYKLEYIPKWGKPYRYDCYMKKDKFNILIEMDGVQHKKDKGYYSKGIKERDIKKNELAKQNNFILIRIDCENTDFNNLKNLLLKSNIINLIDFNNIDWKSVEIKMQENLMKKICEEYNKYDYISLKQLSKIFCVSSKTVEHMLVLGNEINLCDYDKISHNKNGRARKLTKAVDIYDLNNNLIVSIISKSNTYQWVKEKTGGCKIQYVNDCLNGKRISYKNYIFRYHNSNKK